jgi:hypothetical protein
LTESIPRSETPRKMNGKTVVATCGPPVFPLAATVVDAGPLDADQDIALTEILGPQPPDTALDRAVAALGGDERLELSR